MGIYAQRQPLQSDLNFAVMLSPFDWGQALRMGVCVAPRHRHMFMKFTFSFMQQVNKCNL